ncbi:DNA translocase FtsK [Candidatus Dependentiae bacterium]
MVYEFFVAFFVALRNVIFTYKKKIAAFVFLFLAIILGISLYTFNPYDQSWFAYSTSKHSVANLIGFLGSDLSALFFYLFGVSSYLFVLLLSYVSYILFMGVSFKKEVERFLALLGLPFICAALLNMTQVDYFGPIFPGGVIGNGLKIVFIGWFDPVIAKLFTYCLLLISLLLLFRSTVTHVLYLCARVACVVSNKQKFLIPVYNFSRKLVSIILVPLIFSFKFCKRLFCGQDIEGQDRSIVEFENYISDPQEKEELQELYSMLHKNPAVSEMGKESFSQKSIETKNISGKNLEQDFSSSEREKTYNFPDHNLFDYYDQGQEDAIKMDELRGRAKILEEKLEVFGVFGKVVSIKRGPVVTLFEYQPKADSKISKIIGLSDDLALALEALSIRIIAPIPGRSVVGFEVANLKREDVFLSSIVNSKVFENFSGSIPLVLGKDTVGKNIIADLAKMPHLLIAGSTGSGKSVALNSLLVSMLYKLGPDELNLILIDPKRLEFSAYEDIAHLLFPIVTDPKKVSFILKWVVSHMEERYEKMAKVGARNIFDYNNKTDEHMPYLVIIIDELADLMMTVGRDVESLIARIAQMARAAGIHMMVATQRPSVDVITGLIKVNFPSRVSFRVTSKVDSRTILDCSGAEKLLGRGDMLFLGSGSSSLSRLHGAYVSSKEIERVVNHIRLERDVVYRDLSEYITSQDSELSDADDMLYKNILDFLESIEEVSISLLQRKFRIGYNRSARIIEKLESDGLILPSDGGKTRKVVR